MTDNELEIEKINLVLPEDTTLRLIVSKFMVDRNYKDLIVDTYDNELYSDNETINTIIKCQMIYHNKYNDAPSFDTLFAIVDQYAKKSDRLDSKKLLIELKQIQDMSLDFDDHIVKDSIVDLITARMTYYAIINNFEIIKTKKDTSRLLASLQRISSITLDYDLFVTKNFVYYIRL